MDIRRLKLKSLLDLILFSASDDQSGMMSSVLIKFVNKTNLGDIPIPAKIEVAIQKNSQVILQDLDIQRELV